MIRQTVFRLTATLLLYAAAAASLAGDAPAPSGRAPSPLVLADFDRPGNADTLPRDDGTTWEVYPRDPASSLELRRDASQRRGSSGASLFVRYRLGAERASAIGLRLNLRGLDADAYDHLEFWVKGDRALGYADAFKIEFKRPDPEIPGSLETGSYIVTGIGSDWQRIVVPLNFLSGIRHWTHLSEFDIVFQSRRAKVKRGAYYIDDIALIATGDPGPSIHDPVIPVRKRAWERRLGGAEAAKPHLQARLAGWPTRALVPARSLPKDDRMFLWRLARDTWRGLDALSDREHGLPLDTVRFAAGSVALQGARIGDYTSPTDIGLYLLAIAAAEELGFISARQALERLGKTLSTLERLETYRGFFYNYYDTTSLERTSNFISFVDSAWLSAALMVVRMSYPPLYARCSALIERGDYDFFYDDVEQLMSQGYYVNLPYPSAYHYGLLYTESRIGSLIAIGKGEVPEEHWFRMMRTLPPEYAWQSLTPRGRRVKTVRGHQFTGGYYEWKGSRYVPSWGGSMFEALMPTLVLDERVHAPASLGLNDEIHARIQRRYALEELHYPVWGMSPSATPGADRYAGYGVKPLGTRGYQAGVITPHAAALALAAQPQEAVADLHRLTERYEIYGEYGFYDAVDPLSGEVAHKYLALDQGMLLLALANHLGDHCVQRRFAADPIVRKVLPLIGAEDFFE